MLRQAGMMVTLRRHGVPPCCLGRSHAAQRQVPPAAPPAAMTQYTLSASCSFPRQGAKSALSPVHKGVTSLRTQVSLAAQHFARTWQLPAPAGPQQQWQQPMQLPWPEQQAHRTPQPPMRALQPWRLSAPQRQQLPAALAPHGGRRATECASQPAAVPGAGACPPMAPAPCRSAPAQSMGGTICRSPQAYHKTNDYCCAVTFPMD